MFQYDDAITERFPTIRAGLVHATGLVNGPSAAALLDEYRAEQVAVRARLAVTSIAELPSIAAWRRVFSQFGVRPTQHRNAAESLLRRLDKQGDIPTISTLVDIGNMVAIRYALPVAVLDLAGISGSMTVRFATGTERFTDLGSDEIAHPEPGEVVFSDEDDVLSARRWCWRQSAQSATRPGTVDALVTMEGHHDSAEEEIGRALGDLTTLLDRFQPDAMYRAFRMSPERPRAVVGS